MSAHKYTRMLKQRKSYNENAGKDKDCSVMATALLCRLHYKDAYKACKVFGRRRQGQGMYTDQIINTIEALGFKVTKVTNRNGKPLRQSNGSRYTPKTIGQRLKRGYYLCLSSTHAFAVINGEVLDWSSDRKLHITSAYKVERPRTK